MPGSRIDVSETLRILESFDGLPSLKKLQAYLNLDPENSPISRKGWNESDKDLLVADPVITASIGSERGLFGPEQGFKVIYCRLTAPELRLMHERAVVSRLMPHFPYALFVFSDSQQRRFHFLNVKDEPTGQKRRLFRRITVGTGERARTAAEQLSKIDGEDLRNFSLTDIQDRFNQAFDVDRVTQEFFRVFGDVYQRVANEIAAIKGLEQQPGSLAQLLLNRLVFLYFIQKKGWLNGENDYLYRRFKAHHQASGNSYSYYSQVLVPLFSALSNPAERENPLGELPFLNGGLFEEGERRTQADRLTSARALVSNGTFQVVFNDLLERFNFTVTEDTPLDVEVAIDPEMLGKIFESLVLQMEEEPGKDLRRITGSYYTPRSVVHFMCQRALTDFLCSELHRIGNGGRDENMARICALIDSLPAEHLDSNALSALRSLFTTSEARLLSQALLDARVCDPAVGSGAYPVGMLHEMINLIAKFDTILHGHSAIARRNYSFELKKHIIDSCLYGVDIQEEAVRLCELRLWLSLVVDYQLETGGNVNEAIRTVPPLPNLSFRTVQGDSLLERLFGEVVDLDVLATAENVRGLIYSIQADKQAYFYETSNTEKRRLELNVLSKQADLAEHLLVQKQTSVLKTNLTLFGESRKDARLREMREQEEEQLAKLTQRIHSARLAIERVKRDAPQSLRLSSTALRKRSFQTGDAPSFLWRVDFAEVFADKGGFDIVIGNPPYLFGGNVGIAREDKVAFRRFFRAGSGKVNLFTLFIEKGLSLLSESRILVFIIPNTLLRVTSYSAIREIILKESSLLAIVDLGAGVFEDVTMSTIVLSLQKGNPSTGHQFECKDGLLTAGSRMATQADYLAPGFVMNTSASEHELALMRRLESASTQLGDFCKELIFGVVISGNKTGLVREIGGRGWKPFLEGRDIERYFIRPTQKFLHYVPSEIHRPRSPEIFEAPEKLLIQRITGGERPLSVAYDNGRHYNKESINNLILDPQCPYGIKFILAILNSRLMNWYYRKAFTNGSSLTVNLSKEYLSQLPIPKLDMQSQSGRESHRRIVELCEAMLRSGLNAAADHRRLDKLIDEKVYGLYGLSKNEITLIEGH